MNHQTATLRSSGDSSSDVIRPGSPGTLHPAAVSELAVVRQLTQDLRKASSRRYLVDIATTALGGWCAFALAAWSPWPTTARVLCAAIASVLLYRALMFIHEFCHQPRLRGARHVWHLCVGIPALVPLLLYQPMHSRHHRADTYGTAIDGEYEHLQGRCRRVAVRLLLLNFAFPAAILLRFAVLGPLGCLLPIVRRRLLPKFGLSMRMPYDAPPLRGEAAREAARVEVLCSAWAWSLLYGACNGAAAAVAIWAAVLVGVATLNTIRALGCTHLYVEQVTGRSALAQVEDSVNIESSSLATRICCPIGLQYHALHHLAPYLPYHSLAAAHRRLLRDLPADSAYRHASVPSLRHGWQRLLRCSDARAKNLRRAVSRPGHPE